MSNVNPGGGDSEPADPPKSDESPGHYESEEVTLKKVSSEVAQAAAAGEGRRALIGLIIGGVVAGLGVLLIFLQVSGAVDLKLHVGSLSANVTTSVVGLVVVLFGLGIIWATRAKINITDTTA